MFRKVLFVHLPTPAVRVTLFGRKLMERRQDGVTESVLADDVAVLDVLATRFGLHFPAGTSFPSVAA